MSALFVVLMFVAFVAIDFLVREALRRHREKAARIERERILTVAIRTDYAEEARTLKRVEVPEPKARILAVDDEAVVLDSLRRILVLEGFSVDTVENGPEALGLVRTHDYDFVFTDLKMPDMDGVEVVKAVKHLRPDIDVAVITGFGTIETAVETLQHGACEYIQKPFTADELGAFVGRLLVKRQARQEAQAKPVVRVVSPAAAEEAPAHDHCIPGGAFLAQQHLWLRIEGNGQLRLGLDDLVSRALGRIEAVNLPIQGTELHRGDTLLTLKRGTDTLILPSPVSGKVVLVNEPLSHQAGLLSESPYDRGWVCRIQPSALAEELGQLRIGAPAVAWYQDEILRMRETLTPQGQCEWSTFQGKFLNS